MSDALFVLYRYLSQNQDRKDEDNPYNVALRTLDNYLDIQKKLEYWGRFIVNYDGINHQDAKVIRDCIIEGCKTMLCEEAGQSSAKALVTFAASHVNLVNDYDAILIGLGALRAQQVEAARLSDALDESEDF